MWANEFGLTHPVVNDEDFQITDVYWPGSMGRPDALLLAPGGEIVLVGPSPEQVREYFETLDGG